MATRKTPSTNGERNAEKKRLQELAKEQFMMERAAEVNEAPSVRSILQLADDAVNGDRMDNYGSQLQNFTNIADRMTITLREKLVAPITPQEVALLMMDVKLARLMKTGGQHRDSIVDIAGYAECLDKVNSGN